MSYFISEQNLATGSEVEISGEEARHITLARRSKPGDVIILQDLLGKRFNATILKFTRQTVEVEIGESVVIPEESALQLTLFQALTAEQTLDVVLQKATELGVTNIVLFGSIHSPASATNADKKMPRWEKITKEAAKQSDRLKTPYIILAKTIQKVTEELQLLDQAFLLDASSAQTLNSKMLKQGKSVGLIVGPEGGLAEEEIGLLKEMKNVSTINLGPRTLRAETAAISGITLVQHYFGDMG